MNEYINEEELANSLTNAFKVMAKSASEIEKALSLLVENMKQHVVATQLAYIEKLTDKLNKACFLTRWYYSYKLSKEIDKLNELFSSFYSSVSGTPKSFEELN